MMSHNHKDFEQIKNINETVRKSSSSLLDYFITIENELIKAKWSKLRPILTYKMYVGALGVARTTHSHPIGQTCTGWNKPHKSEIGWNGRVLIAYEYFSYQKNLETEFITTCIHTGTGGYAGGEQYNQYKLNTDSVLFIKDLPLVYEQYLKFIDNTKDLFQLYHNGYEHDKSFALGIINNSNFIKSNIISMLKILQGWTSPVKRSFIEYFIQLHLPFYNNSIQREIWLENKNLGWYINDLYYKYTDSDSRYSGL